MIISGYEQDVLSMYSSQIRLSLYWKRRAVCSETFSRLSTDGCGR